MAISCRPLAGQGEGCLAVQRDQVGPVCRATSLYSRRRGSDEVSDLGRGVPELGDAHQSEGMLRNTSKCKCLGQKPISHPPTNPPTHLQRSNFGNLFFNPPWQAGKPCNSHSATSMAEPLWAAPMWSLNHNAAGWRSKWKPLMNFAVWLGWVSPTKPEALPELYNSRQTHPAKLTFVARSNCHLLRSQCEQKKNGGKMQEKLRTQFGEEAKHKLFDLSVHCCHVAAW